MKAVVEVPTEALRHAPHSLYWDARKEMERLADEHDFAWSRYEKPYQFVTVFTLIGDSVHVQAALRALMPLATWPS